MPVLLDLLRRLSIGVTTVAIQLLMTTYGRYEIDDDKNYRNFLKTVLGLGGGRDGGGEEEENGRVVGGGVDSGKWTNTTGGGSSPCPTPIPLRRSRRGLVPATPADSDTAAIQSMGAVQSGVLLQRRAAGVGAQVHRRGTGATDMTQRRH